MPPCVIALLLSVSESFDTSAPFVMSKVHTGVNLAVLPCERKRLQLAPDVPDEGRPSSIPPHSFFFFCLLISPQPPFASLSFLLQRRPLSNLRVGFMGATPPPSSAPVFALACLFIFLFFNALSVKP